MPGTFSTDLSTISSANSTSDAGTWAKVGSQSIAAESDAKIEGANCIKVNTGGTVSPNDAGCSLNLTSTFNATDKHLFFWRNTSTPSNLNTKANQGFVLHLTSDTTYANPGTNYKKWYIDGSDTYLTGGWKCYAVYPAGTPDASGGTLDITAIKNVANLCRMQTSVTTTFPNTFYDAIRLGTGLTIKDGGPSSPATFSDVYTADSLGSNAWGILTSTSNIYFGAGKFNFGTLSQTAITYFKDTDQVLVFRDYPVLNIFYEIVCVGAALYITTFRLGNYSGGLASNGCTIKGAGNVSSSSHAVWTFTGSNSNAVVNLYNSNFSEMRRGVFNSSSEIRYCTFTNFGDITPNGCVVDTCTFQNVKTGSPVSGTYALILNATSEADAIINCKFINCNRAIKITTAGTYNFNNLTFSGNTYDIENSSAGAVTIQTSNGANPTTYINTGGGSVSIQTSATLTMNIVDSDGAAITSTSATFTADAGTNVITSGNHGLTDGKLIYMTTTGTLPGGLSTNTNYFIISSTTNTFKVSTISGGSEVDITSTGTGTHTWVSGNACEVTVVRVSDTTVLYQAENVTTGTTNYVYTTGGGTATYINVHNVTGYANKTVYQTLPSSGTTTITIQLDDDRMYNNP